MAESESQTPPEQEFSKHLDNPMLVRQSHGNLDLLNLLAAREDLWDEGVRMRQETGEIPDEHVDAVKALNARIRTLREELKLDPYE